MADYQSLLSSTKISQIICTTIKTIIFHQISPTPNTKQKDSQKPITPPSESASEEDSDPEQAQRDKDIQKKLGHISFKYIVKKTDWAVWEIKGRAVAEGKLGRLKPKRAKDYTYHKEKMLLCKQVKKGVPLQVPTADSVTDTEPLEQVQYDAEYNVFANERHHSEQPKFIGNTCVVEKVDSNVIPDSPNMCNNDIQSDQDAEECDDECVALVNLIANLKLDVDENKKIQKQLKKANTSLAHELKECNLFLREN
ncbi:hypothetical protein Tco_0439956 [Tanacetum coccineum]